MKNIFSEKEEIFIKSGTVIDVAYTVPMLSGFPLSLTGFGAYSLDLSYYGSLHKNLSSLDFNGKLRPSLSMELSTAMSNDLFYATTEIKVKSNIYSNYAIEVEAQSNSSSYASLQLKIPQDRNDILSLRSQLISKIQETETVLNGISDRYMNSSCSWPSAEAILGLKLCVDYSLPDVSNVVKNYPSLLLSGPIVVDMYLAKSDMSAKMFDFEYRWNKYKDSTEGSITFETPSSLIPRKFSGKLKTDSENYNTSVEFKNGAQTHTALGYFKNSPNEKSVDFSVSINDKEHFNQHFSWKKVINSKSRSKITPMFLLVINDQKIAGMIGSIKILEKNNISQYDVDLRFETKRMMSSAFGQIIRTETSLNSEMQYTYKFSGKKEETIDVSTEIANRSQKLRGRTEYIGSFKFISSAYTNYNFYSYASFLSSLGHIETRFDLNNAPDLKDPAYTITTKMNLAKQTEDSKHSRTMFSVEITRPKSQTDLKFYVKYDENYKNGTEHNVLILIRYSPKKEVIATGSILLPRGPLYGIDATFSVSIPDLNKASAAVKIKETVKKEYLVR